MKVKKMVYLKKIMEKAEKIEEIAGRTVFKTGNQIYILKNEHDERFTEHVYGAKRFMEERLIMRDEVINTDEFKKFREGLTLKVSQYQDDEDFTRFVEIFEVI